MMTRLDPHQPPSGTAVRKRSIRDIGDIILSLAPFIAIAVLITIGAVKARCGG